MTDTITLILTLIIIRMVDSEISSRCECLTYTKTFGKEFGTFNSPDYPRSYPPAVDCLLFTFVADANEIVEITFKDFNVYKTNDRCMDGDYVKVYAHVETGKINEYTPWDRVLCGKYPDIPHVIYSSVPTLVLQFHSAIRPSNVNCSGFIGTFRFLDKRIFETDGRRISGNRCDQQFESGNGSLQGRFYSPRYPASYPRSSRCNYHFKARPEERVKLVFEELTLQKGDDSCINREDLIKVYDGYGPIATMVLLLCNEVAGTEVFSTGPNLYVEFVANDQWPGQGFKASYYFQSANGLHNFNEIQQAGSCDKFIRSIDSRNGSLTSPLYPRPYPSNSRCLYVFQAHGRERVQLIFQDLNLYRSPNEVKTCPTTDSIIVYNKVEERLEKIIALCERDVALPVMSSGPTLVLEFVGLNSSQTNTGFKAFYNFVEDFGVKSGKQLSILPCAFQYNSTDSKTAAAVGGSFTSPNFRGLYPRDVECHYFFYARHHERIRIEFEYFDVEGVSPCDEHSESDYVELSNYMAHDLDYARYCGNLTAWTVTSTRNFFRVTFRSNRVLDGRGFRANYRFVNESSPTEKVAKPNSARVQKNQVIPSEFVNLVQDDPRVASKLCRHGILRRGLALSRPRIETHDISFKEIHRKPMIAQVVRCSSSTAIIQAPPHNNNNCAYLLQLHKRGSKANSYHIDKKFCYIRNRVRQVKGS